MTYISSTSNPRIRDVIKLFKSRERKASGKFIIEGYREICRAIKGGIEIETIFYCPDQNNVEHIEFLKKFSGDNLIEISKNVFSRIAYRDNHDGLLAVAIQFKWELDDLPDEETPLFLVVESVEKPGNLGAILRTADAAGLSAVIVCNNQTDIFNPNVVRSSLGCLFTRPVIRCSSEEAIQYFKKNHIHIFASALQKSIEYYEADFMQPTAIVMGSEAHGLGSPFRKAAHQIIKIPMFGVADSLNVSVSAAILMYEAVRQRFMGLRDYGSKGGSE